MYPPVPAHWTVIHRDLTQGWQGPKHLGHPALLSQAHLQAAGLELEQL